MNDDPWFKPRGAPDDAPGDAARPPAEYHLIEGPIRIQPTDQTAEAASNIPARTTS